jgi:hypothetical protein
MPLQGGLISVGERQQLGFAIDLTSNRDGQIPMVTEHNAIDLLGFQVGLDARSMEDGEPPYLSNAASPAAAT